MLLGWCEKKNCVICDGKVANYCFKKRCPNLQIQKRYYQKGGQNGQIHSEMRGMRTNHGMLSGRNALSLLPAEQNLPNSLPQNGNSKGQRNTLP